MYNAVIKYSMYKCDIQQLNKRVKMNFLQLKKLKKYLKITGVIIPSNFNHRVRICWLRKHSSVTC